jgi:hypothetical protein
VLSTKGWYGWEIFKTIGDNSESNSVIFLPVALEALMEPWWILEPRTTNHDTQIMQTRAAIPLPLPNNQDGEHFLTPRHSHILLYSGQTIQCTIQVLRPEVLTIIIFRVTSECNTFSPNNPTRLTNHKSFRSTVALLSTRKAAS